MAPSIETCPPEVVETFVQNLELHDISNLRLTSRCMANLATQETYKHFFKSKKVLLSKLGLEQFADITGFSDLACSVQNLNIVGLAVDTQQVEEILSEGARWETESHGPIFSSRQHKCSEQELNETRDGLEALQRQRQELIKMNQDGTDAKLLRRALRNIASAKKDGWLPSLSLGVSVLREASLQQTPPVEGGNYETIWQAAGHCFQTTMDAVDHSRLSVDVLDLYSSLWRCSLGLDHLKPPMRPVARLAIALKSVKTLRMSLCETPRDDLEPKAEVDDTPLRSATNDVATLADLLRLMPNLEALEMHWYKARSYRSAEDAPLSTMPMFEALKNVELPRLTSLNLRGIYISGEALLSLLKRLPLKTLSLAKIRVETEDDGATFTSLFEHCASKDAALDNICFDDLYGRLPLHFTGVGHSKFPRLDEHLAGGSVLERSGDAVRKYIAFHWVHGRMMGSPQGYRYMNVSRRDYGPP